MVVSRLSASLSTPWRVVLLLLICGGVVLRLIWPETMVFLNDQARACAMAADIAEGRWEAAGLSNSAGFRNPPGFVYLLAAVWRVWPDPLALLYFIQAVNLLALALTAYLFMRWLPSDAAWWGLALLATAPWAIQYCRWIWAQDLLFPAAIMTYGFLWLWTVRRRPWAALGVAAGLIFAIQIHLAGGVLALSCAVAALLLRPPWRWPPVMCAIVLAAPLFAPYALALREASSRAAQPRTVAGDGAVKTARDARALVNETGADESAAAQTGQSEKRNYREVWRIVPAVAMSVSGLLWSLEFKAGYPAFVASLGWRHHVYQALQVVPLVLFVSGAWFALRLRAPAAQPATTAAPAPPAMPTAPPETAASIRLLTLLTVTIPLIFVVLGLRVSPTYLPVWYPVPFALMGLAAARWSHPALRLGLTLMMAGQLAFFAEQLRYQHQQGGVPGSILDAHYGKLRHALDSAPAEWRAHDGPIYAEYAGPSDYLHEPTAFLLRRRWSGATANVGADAPSIDDRLAAEHSGAGLLIRFDPWQAEPFALGTLPPSPATNAYRISPRAGPHQVAGKIPRE